MKIKTAMIMAAGLGTRMHPLTLDTPKPLIPFLGKPLIDHVLEAVKAHGIEHIVVNTHYLSQQIQDHLARHHPDVIVAYEPERLETGGGVKAAMHLFVGDPILMINPDVMLTTPLPHIIGRLEAAWDEHHMDGLLALCPKTACHSFFGAGDYDFTQESHIRWRGTQAESDYFCVGLSVLKRAAYASFDEPYFSNKAVWDRLEANNRLSGWVIPGEAYDISSIPGLAYAEKHFLHE